MPITIFHVDAFTDQLFSGNPAAVCLLHEWLEEDTLRLIARENNLPVTAFVVRVDDRVAIRWLTPDAELDLCGHGTLAAAFVLFNYVEPTWQEIKFESAAGLLPVSRQDAWITLHFPAKLVEVCTLNETLRRGFGHIPVEIYQYKNERLLAVFKNEEEVKNIKLDMNVLKNLAHRGIIVTAPSTVDDFVSRTFYPHKLIPEDAVTGASHCLLVPFWAKRLGKNNLVCRQVSLRGGKLRCEYKEQHVLISSQATLYSQGSIFI